MKTTFSVKIVNGTKDYSQIRRKLENGSYDKNRTPSILFYKTNMCAKNRVDCSTK